MERMRLVYSALLLADALLLAQTNADTIADRILARIDAAHWGAPYDKSGSCQPRNPSQQVFGADGEWSDRCTSHSDSLIEESYFYAFDESGPMRLKIEVRPEPPANSDVAPALREKLTRRFGAPVHEPTMIEIGLPLTGDHWTSEKLHYFLFQNPGAVQLIAVDSRLFREIQKDPLFRQTDVLFYPASPSRPFLQQLLGDPYTRLLDADPKTPSERQDLAQEISSEALGLLGVASRSLMDERAMLFLAANALVAKLSTLLWINDEKGEREIPDAASIRAALAKFGVKLGGMLHNNGVLAYNQDLLWRVWREFPDSQAGQLAFLELQQHGWDTSWANYSDKGCPANPDLFHDVIEHGEAFLAQHPASPFRKEVLFTLAVANESWWSVAHAPADDEWISAVPYPRKNLNKEQAAAAGERAIDYYRQIVKLAPDSPEAASAERRLPRLKLGLDTGQRRFFCSYD